MKTASSGSLIPIGTSKFLLRDRMGVRVFFFVCLPLSPSLHCPTSLLFPYERTQPCDDDHSYYGDDNDDDDYTRTFQWLIAPRRPWPLQKLCPQDSLASFLCECRQFSGNDYVRFVSGSGSLLAVSRNASNAAFHFLFRFFYRG